MTKTRKEELAQQRALIKRIQARRDNPDAPSLLEGEITNFEDAVLAMVQGRPVLGENGAANGLLKQLLETSIALENGEHVNAPEEKAQGNHRNGYNQRKLQKSIGDVDFQLPRDRNGTFDSALIPKHARKLPQDIEDKIMSMFRHGVSYQDISDSFKEIYGTSISAATISEITDKVHREIEQWQSRALDSIYAVVWLDAIHYKVRKDGKYFSCAAYTVLGINMEGQKDILGIYVSESEGAKHWASVLADLQNRGVQDILIVSVDGLKGFPEAIASIYPKADVQKCIVHQIRNSTKYIPYKDLKEFMLSLKQVYKAATLKEAELGLVELRDQWGKKYHMAVKTWEDNWEYLSTYFDYPESIRRIMYTTNAVESVHRQFRKLTKTKGGFMSERALMKLLYVGVLKVSKKWTMPPHGWKAALSSLSIRFEDRLKGTA